MAGIKFSLLTVLVTLGMLGTYFLSSALGAKGGERVDGQIFYDQSYLGEQESLLYYGPNSPDLIRESVEQAPQFLDQLYLERYWDRLIPAVPNHLESFLTTQLSQSRCPNFVLSRHLPYLRYLFRLLTISYLYEELKYLKRVYYGIGGGRVVCADNVGAILNQCNMSPISKEMRVFIDRSKQVLSHERLPYELRHFKQQEIKQLLKRINHQAADQEGLAMVMQWHCSSQGQECTVRDVGQLKTAIESRCIKDRQLISDLCQEVDQVYGLSTRPEAILLLVESNVKNLFRSSDEFGGCMERFGKIFAGRERRYSILDHLFPIVSHELQQYPSARMLGVLFLPGALKEFDDLGLKNFIYRAKPKPKKIVKKLLPKPKPRVKPKVKLKPKPKPKPKPKAVPKPKPKPKPKAKPLSAFELAVAIRSKNDLPRYPVDMDAFKQDFTFTAKQRDSLQGSLVSYQTQKALRQMQQGDDLGSREEPVLLFFLKYLIDNNQHQGLYNIQTVLGNQFFLLNDIDKKEIPTYVELKNDKSTGYQWQVNVLPTPEKGEDSE
ncbi:MAG: hypothetical protein HN482_09575 [Bdellovibrionales bacterium]|mgnify:CR=1 FL=1|nr:hypothetical protein [Bdellovibrionales bacterium]MBT7668650.1 hypothetical protein [Bdellovibrionales bacterium]